MFLHLSVILFTVGGRSLSRWGLCLGGLCPEGGLCPGVVSVKGCVVISVNLTYSPNGNSHVSLIS